jgi:hypothetical protein
MPHLPGVIESPWSFAVTIVFTSFRSTGLSTGSGFFWRSGGRTYLVSNWHVLSGRNAETQQPADHGAIPDRVQFIVYRREGEKDAAGLVSLKFGMTDVALYEDDACEAPTWLEHPEHGRGVDIAAVDVTDWLPPNLMLETVGGLEGDAAVEPRVGDDAFVLGYPLGPITDLPTPVWKRATVATEPSLNAISRPCVLVDTASRPGMSGSIVIVRKMLFGPFPKKDGTTSQTLYAMRDIILGVYSGRLGKGDMEAQLGIVWKRHLIDEVVQGGRPGPVGMK